MTPRRWEQVFSSLSPNSQPRKSADRVTLQLPPQSPYLPFKHDRMVTSDYAEHTAMQEDSCTMTAISMQDFSDALKIGARSFFREKYPEMVKVYFVGSYSKEFCGGPHVKNTSEIGSLKIYKFEKIGSNLYRIYAK